jgi:hypothetical protein
MEECVNLVQGQPLAVELLMQDLCARTISTKQYYYYYLLASGGAVSDLGFAFKTEGARSLLLLQGELDQCLD